MACPMTVAEHAIADYDGRYHHRAGGSSAGGGRRRLPRSRGNPAAVEAERPPMRLALGGWAEGIIRKEIADRSADLENWSRLTRSVDNS